MKNKLIRLSLIISLVGLFDAAYLTYKHYSFEIVPCSNNIFVDCGQVLNSVYSMIFGIPVSLLGLFHYLLIFSFLIFSIKKQNRIFKYLLLLESLNGFMFSGYLVFLQVFIIGSIFLYCMISAIISFTLFFMLINIFKSESKRLILKLIAIKYKLFIKPLLFKIEAERNHEFVIKIGCLLGKNKLIKIIIGWITQENKTLVQSIAGIEFKNPIGLAAGFDYNADLTSFLPSLGFGFMSVGTITNMPYEGNPKPRLGRLPKSKSLMVNKGFKNIGVKDTAKKLKNLIFDIPVGISIGRSNNDNIMTQRKSIEDIISALKIIEQEKLNNAYYEINISCPNLIHAGKINFYEPAKLKELLESIDKLNLRKPVFIKMPIDRTDKDTLKILEVISKYNITGVIFGNLQKNRNHSSINPNEVKIFKQGNFSGRPTAERSNELIELTYKNYKNRFVIVGCGGVFNAQDAYEKIIRGASLIQLITGLIFEGPQLVSQINFQLADILKKHKFNNISEVVGLKFK